MLFCGGFHGGLSMKKLYFIAVAAILTGCATGQSIHESQEAVAPIASGEGRIVVYRSGVFGAGIQPAVFIDGEKKGLCKPRGAFFADVASGDHVVTAETEVKRETMVHVSADQPSYVRCSVSMGLIVGRPKLEVVPPKTGKMESDKLVLTGKY
jgi:hypothetical protein